MAFGLQVLNESSSVQIDADYTNLVLVQRGSVNTVADYANNLWTCTVTYTSATNPLVAIRQTSIYGAMRMWNYTRSGNTHTWVFSYDSNGGQTVDPRGVTQLSASIMYYIFDIASATETGFGLRVNNAAGNNIYTYTQKPMNCLGIYPGPRVYNPADPGFVSYQFSTGRTYAYIFAGSNFVLQKYNSATTTRIFSPNAFLSSSNLFRIGRTYRYATTWNTSTPNAMYNDDVFLVVDVTGY